MFAGTAKGAVVAVEVEAVVVFVEVVFDAFVHNNLFKSIWSAFNFNFHSNDCMPAI